MNDTDHLADERYMRMALEEAHRAQPPPRLSAANI